MPSVDNRAVEMLFDNKQFEQGVKQTTESLKNLKTELAFDRVATGLETLEAKVSQIAGKFTTMGIAGITAIQKMTERAIDAGERMAKSLSVDQISAGWTKYADKTAAVQTIMASTAKQFSDTTEQMQFVNDQLDKMNWFTDETSYNFVNMTSSVGKFTANNIALEDAVTAMQGIATWAALSGANAQKADMAMYNLSQSIGMGAVKSRDWASIENANMATAEFKEIAIETAVAMGTLQRSADGVIKTISSGKNKKSIEVSVENFRETLQEGWFDKKVLMETLDQYGGFTNKLFEASEKTGLTATQLLKDIDGFKDGTLDLEKAAKRTGVSVEDLGPIYKELGDDQYALGRKAFEAAQEAKTFAEAIEATKDAVSTGWMKSFELIFGNYLEAKALWTGLADILYETFGASAEARNEMLGEWKEKGGRNSMLQALLNIINTVRLFSAVVKDAFADVFGSLNADGLVSATKKFEGFTQKVFGWLTGSNEHGSRLAQLTSVFRGFFSVLSIGKKIVGAVWQTITGFLKGLGVDVGAESLLAKLAKIGDSITAFNEKLGKFLGKNKPDGQAFGKTIRDIISPVKEMSEAQGDAEKAGTVTGGIIGFLSDLGKKVLDFASNFSGFDIAGIIMLAIGGLIGIKIFSIMNNISKAVRVFRSGFTDIMDSISSFGRESNLSSKVMQFGAAIASIASAFYLVSQVDPDRILSSIIVLGVITGALIGLTYALKRVSLKEAASLTVVSGTIMVLAVAVNLIAIAIRTIGELNPENMAGAVLSLGATLLMLAGFLAITKKLKMGPGTAISLVVLGMAMKTFAKAIAMLGALDAGALVKGIVGMGLVLLELAAFMAMTKKLGFGLRTAAALVILGVAMKVFAKAIISLSDLSIGQILTAVAGMGLVLLELAIFMALAKKLKFGMFKAVGLIVLGLAMQQFAKAIVALGALNPEQMKTAVAGMGAVFLELIAFAALSKLIGPNSFKIDTLLGVAFIVSEFSKALVRLGDMDPAKMKSGIIGLGAVMLEILIFSALASKVKLGFKFGFALMAVALAIKLFASSIVFLGEMKYETLKQGIIGLGLVLLEIGIFARLIKKANINARTGLALFLIGQALKSFAASIAFLGNLNTKVLLKGIGGMGLVLLEMAIFMHIAKRAGMGVGKGATLLLIGLSMKAFASSITMLGSLPVGAILKGVLALGIILAEALIFMNSLKSVGAKGIGKAIVVLAVMSIAMIAFAVVVRQLTDVDVGVMVGFATSLGVGLLAVTATLMIFSKIPITGILMGILGLGLAVAGIIGLMALFGELEKATNISSSIEAFGKLLASMGEAIGSFIGGFMQGMFKNFSNIGLELSLFMEALQPFLAGLKQIDTTAISGVSALVDLMTSIAGANIANAISGWIAGGNSMKKFADDMVLIGEGISAYAKAVSGFDKVSAKDVKAATMAAKGISELANSLPRSGGVLQKLIGAKDLAKFSKDIPGLGESLSSYATSVKGISKGSKGDFKAAADAAKGISELANSLPRSGGWVQAVIGAKDLGKFSEGIGPLGESLSEYAGSIKGIGKGSSGDFKAAADAAKGLSELANSIPSSGGFAQKVLGAKDLAAFGSQLGTLGEGLSKYLTAISTVENADPIKIKNANVAAKGLAALAEAAPAQGGVLQWFTGSANLAEFASSITSLGSGLASYVTAITGVEETDDDKILNANKAIGGLKSLIEAAPAVGGVSQWFSGNIKLGEYASHISSLGDALSSYVSSISKITDPGTTVDSANKAAAGLSTLIAVAPTTGGMAQWITGAVNLSEFAGQVPLLGAALLAYVGSISELTAPTDEQNAAAVKAAEGLAALVSVAPPTDGFIQWLVGEKNLGQFATDMPDLGKALKAYVGSISEITAPTDDQNTAAAKAAEGLAALTQAAPKEGGLAQWLLGETNLTKFATEMPLLGSALRAYVAHVKDIEAPDGNQVKAASAAAEGISALAASAPKTGGLEQWLSGSVNLTEFANQMPTIGGALKAYVDEVGKIEAVEGSVENAKLAAEGIAALAEAAPVMGGIGKLITGSKNLEEFSKQMKPIGEGLSAYAQHVGGMATVDATALTNAKMAIDGVAAIAAAAPVLGGVGSLFSGQVNIEEFTQQIPKIGAALNEYAEATKDFADVDTGHVASAKLAAEGIAVLAGASNDLSSLIWMVEANGTDTSSFGTKAGNLGGGVSSLITTLGGVTGDGITNAQKAVEAIAGKGDAKGMVSSLREAVKDLNDNAVKNSANLSTFATNISTFVTSLSSIKPLPEKDIDAILKTVELFNDKASFNSEFARGFIEAWGDDAIVSASESMATFGTNFKSFTDGLSGITSSESNFGSLTTLINNINGLSTSSITTNLEKLEDSLLLLSSLTSGDDALAFDSEVIKTLATTFGSDIMGSIAEGVSSSEDPIKIALETALGNVLNNITKLNTKFESAGRMLTEGVARGISSGAYLAINAAMFMAKKVLNTIDTVWQIRSPARAGLVRAKFLNQGIAKGAKDTRDLPLKEMRKTAYKTITAIDNEFGKADPGKDFAETAVDNISNALGSLEAKPISFAGLGTNTTNVLENLANIFGFLPKNEEKPEVTVVTTHNSSSTSSGKGSGSPKVVDPPKSERLEYIETVGLGLTQSDELGMLGKKIEELSNTISNMKIVMDSGALVGQLAPAMDKKLASDSVYAGRR